MEIKPLNIANLTLDLANFRTTRQENEQDAVHAMMATDKERFLALLDSFLQYGLLPNENLVVIKSGEAEAEEYVVMEGNRRTAALKIILGQISTRTLPLPAELQQRIREVRRRRDSRARYETVLCAIFGQDELELVDQIVSITHGKGELSGRTPWNSVATARHNREKNDAVQLDLNLLESYLIHGENLDQQEKELWAARYPLTVLAETITRLASRLGRSAAEIVSAYPDSLECREAIEKILHDIGCGEFGFPSLRRDGLSKYGIPTRVT